MKRYVIFVAVICLGIMVTTPALGQKKAKDLFDEGIVAIEAGKFEEALSALQEAYEISPHWAVLPHIGNCYANLNRPIEAISTFEKYLETGGTNISDEEQEIAREMIRKEKKKVGVLVLEVGKSGVEAKVDGESIGTSPFEKTLLMPGRHEVTVRFNEQNIVTRSVTLQTGEELLLRVKEEEPEATAPPSPVVAESESEETEEEAEEEEETEEEELEPGEGSYVPAYVAGGVAAAGLIAGGVGFGMYIHYNATANNYQETLDDLRVKYPDDFGDFTWEDTCAEKAAGDRELNSEEEVYFCNTEIKRQDMDKKKKPWFIVGAVGAGVFGLALIPTILFALNPKWFGKGDNQVSSISVIPVVGPDNNGFLLNLNF